MKTMNKNTNKKYQILVILYAFTFFITASVSKVLAFKSMKTTTKSTENSEQKDYRKGEPGHIIDGSDQMILKGTNIKLYLTCGSAQIHIRKNQGRLQIPVGARYKEKHDRGSFGSTKKLSSRDEDKWFEPDARRIVFLAGRSVGTKEKPLILEGDSSLIVRGYNAAVCYKIDEKDEEVSYRFPLRDAEAEAKEVESLARLNSANPFIRAKERFLRAGGLMAKRNGRIFNGF